MKPVKPVTPTSRTLHIYNTQHTCTHISCHNLGLGGFPTLRGSDSTKTQIRWKNPNVFVYPLEWRRKGVGQWTFLFGCVRLVHRKVGNQSLPQINTIFHPIRPKREFSLLVQKLTREKVKPVKPVTPRSRILHIYNTQHTCIHMVWPNLGFGCGSDAPGPRFGETLNPLEKP